MQPGAVSLRRDVAAAPRRALRLTATVCGGAGITALLVGAVVGQELYGVALALGLALGAGNGFLAERLLRLGAAFAATSLVRLLFLTLLAVASGAILGWHPMIFVAAGMAAAQLVLSAASLREVLRQA